MFGIGPAELVAMVVLFAVANHNCAISGVAPAGPVVAIAQAGAFVALGVALSQWAGG